jgi:hypothetical protein
VSATINPHKVPITKFELIGGYGSITNKQLCIMQMASVLDARDRGLPLDSPDISDAPPCVNSLVRTVAINYNDASLDADRQKMRPLLRAMMGTAKDGKYEARRRYVERTFTKLYTGEPEYKEAYKLTDKAGYIGTSMAEMSSKEALAILKGLIKG